MGIFDFLKGNNKPKPQNEPDDGFDDLEEDDTSE
jgi:hypothetical protein